MVTQYDEKGKIFTQVVSKQPVLVTIRTNHEMIRGCIHVSPGMRIKDELNSQELFIAVTEAVVLNSQNEEIYRSNFLVVNKDQIIWVSPEEEIAN